MKNFNPLHFIPALIVLSVNNINAQNPFIQDQFSADPSARVFNGKVYVYPSHDIRAPESMARKDWFCMEDYHVFSSSNLTDWTDHGIIASQNRVNWIDSTSFSMWAPDCIERNGIYYMTYPHVQDKIERLEYTMSDNPMGPFNVTGVIMDESPAGNDGKQLKHLFQN
jgi:beta-xylosidase